jgi:hypothetical protein
MTLKELINSKEKLGENQYFLNTGKGYGIALERFETFHKEDFKYLFVSNLNAGASVRISCGSNNAHLLSNGKRDNFSMQFDYQLRELKNKLPNPMKNIETQTKNTYEKIISQLDIQPVKSRPYVMLACGIVNSIISPITVPTAKLTVLGKRLLNKKEHTDQYLVFSALVSGIPTVIEASKMMFNPPITHYKLKNTNIFVPFSDHEKPDSNLIAIGFSFNMYDDLSNIEPPGKPILFLENELMVNHEGFVEKSLSQFYAAKNYLQVDPELREKLLQANEQKKNLFNGLRKFREEATPEQLEELVKEFRVHT